MSSSPSPVVANWELVLRLRERREQLGVSVNDLTADLGFTRNYWSAIENERKIVPESTLIKLFDILEFNDEDRQQLLQAAGSLPVTTQHATATLAKAHRCMCRRRDTPPMHRVVTCRVHSDMSVVVDTRTSPQCRLCSDPAS